MNTAFSRSRPIALEASGLLSRRPTGVAVYGRGLIHGLLEAMGHRCAGGRPASTGLRLICPASRWRRRGAVRDLGLPVRPYTSGRCLSWGTSLVHLLDTRFPRGYRGPLVATIFDTISALPLSAELNLASERFRRRKLAAYEEIAARADAIITLASAVREEFLSRFPAGRVEVIPPGVDLPDGGLRARARGLLHEHGIEGPFLLSVGALCPRKNLETVIDVYLAAARRWPELRLVLAGSPDYGWTGSAAEQAASRSEGRIRLAGYLPRDVLWAALMEARCVLQLSHYEGYGLTVLEALAAGAPVIASRRGGLPEAGGEEAWLVEPGDVRGALGALERVLAQGREITDRRLAGQSRARSFTWQKAAAAILKVYQEVLERRRGL